MADAAWECLCGTPIPESGTDWEPRCRHCERTHLNRQLQAIDDTPGPDTTRCDECGTVLAKNDDARFEHHDGVEWLCDGCIAARNDPDVRVYYGAASGQQRAALRRLDPEAVMISHATENNQPFPGDYDLFVDCGGYHHMVTGSGEYGDDHGEYLDYIADVEPHRWALRDYPCEPDLLEDLGRSVRDHQQRTTEAHADLLARATERGLTDGAVAVVQGWTLEDYDRHLDALFDAGVLGQSSPVSNVAIGSVCRRNQDAELAEVIRHIRSELPHRYTLHAFGVKKNVLRFREVARALDSVDSCAYDYTQSRQPDSRPGASFTWRDSARAYLNWRHDLQTGIGQEQLDGHGVQASLAEVGDDA